jgi:hypothetical protein
MRRVVAVAVLAMLVAAGGCGGSGGGDPSPSASPAGSEASPSATPEQSPTAAETPSPSTPPSPSAAAAEPAILADGLGIVSFGAPADAVIEALSGRYGAPTNDTGWVAELPTYGDCPGNVREVTWGPVLAGFLDGASPYAPGGPHFINYQIGLEGAAQGGPRSPEGIGLGSTVEDLQAAYADRLQVVTESERGVAFRITSADPARPDDRISGLTTRESGVIGMSAGYICS